MNFLRTAILLAGLTALFMGVGYLIGGASGAMIALVVAAAMNVFAYWNSDRMVLSMHGAQEVDARTAPDLYGMVRELSARAGLPMPRVYLIDEEAPNAFATGRNPRNAAVCCTTGILEILTERELRAVLGHELSHVYNRDILTGSVAAGIAGVISSISTAVLWFGGGRGRRDQGSAIALLVLAILAPLAASLTQFAVSRTREFDADRDGAELTGDPLALASALRRLETGVEAAPLARDPRVEPVSSMMIANPFGRMRSLFATHPPMGQRISRLEQMAGY